MNSTPAYKTVPGAEEAAALILDAAVTGTSSPAELPGLELALCAVLSIDGPPAAAVLADALLDAGNTKAVEIEAARRGAVALWDRYEDPYREDINRLQDAVHAYGAEVQPGTGY